MKYLNGILNKLPILNRIPIPPCILIMSLWLPIVMRPPKSCRKTHLVQKGVHPAMIEVLNEEHVQIEYLQ